MRALVHRLVALATVAAVAACSSSSSGSGSQGGGTIGGGDGGTTCTAFGTAVGIGTSAGTPTDPCPACILSSCRAEYNAAFGATAGVPGGACKAYWDCVCTCPSAAGSCQADCAMNKLTEACATAQEAFSDCTDAKCAAACN